MNETEETMSHALPTNTLIAHSKALEAAGMSIALVIRVSAPLKSIARLKRGGDVPFLVQNTPDVNVIWCFNVEDEIGKGLQRP